MLFQLFFINIKFIIFLLKVINSFFILPFDTIYIKDKNIIGNDYYNILFQNELYTNLSIGNPLQVVKSLLKMEISGFSIYQGAFNHNISLTAEKGIWDLNVDRILRFMTYPIKDFFYFFSFKSYNEFENYLKLVNNKENNEIILNITKTNKTSFLINKDPPQYSNKNYYFFGMIGLRLNVFDVMQGPEFITSFKKSNDIKSYIFSFKFNKDNYTYKNFFNNYNKGYFIYGEELTDDENEKDKIKYTDAQKNQKGLSWYIFFKNIYTKSNNINIINNIEFKAKKLGGEFILNIPYIIGTDEYLEYINITFFNELINKKLCSFNLTNNKKNLYSFICDGVSQYFMNYLYLKFPDLVFEHNILEENFILTKNDLFSFNTFNKSDNNLYFLIMFEKDNKYNWTLGIPFLKKYRLSFNYETKKIGYYKDKENFDQINENEDNKKISLVSIFIKIIIIVILIFIIFILGMLFQKKIIKIPRKIKANELDDNYEYDSYKNMQNNDINNSKKIQNNKEVELGLKI